MVAPQDLEAVRSLLGREPTAAFEVVVRDRRGVPVVIRNEPLMSDGTPMPTRYWLVGAAAREAVSRLESAGGVAAAEAAVPADALAAAHARYAGERDAALPVDHRGPRPSGGVGGTRRGIKCLHAHLAWYLAGGADPVGRFVVDRLAGDLEGPVAAFDLGTHSTRLLVLAADGSVLEREMLITALGRGALEGGELEAAAIERTLVALRRYRSLAESHGVVRFRAAATAAVREAANGERFLDAADSALGIRPQVLGGEEEGRLAYLGATGDAAGSGGFLVVDVGGGSTELIAGSPEGAGVVAVSLPVGCVRLSEAFLHGDPPAPGELSFARGHVAGLVQAALRRHPSLAEHHQVIGVAGTVAALCSIQLGLPASQWDQLDGAALSRDEVERLLGSLAAETLERRRARRELEPERASVIVGGAVVLAAVLEALGAGRLVHSAHDLLDGLAREMLAPPE